MSDILYDVALTKKAFEKHLSLSWSAFDNFQSCQGNWFINYFLKAPPEALITIEKESSRAIPGTIIQKLFEVFINNRVYKRPEMKSLKNLTEWCQRNIVGLFHLSYFDMRDQHLPDFVYTKDLFKKTVGKSKLKQIQKEFGMDTAFDDINVSYIHDPTFNSIYTSKEKLLNRICEMIPKILELFVKMELNLDRTQSEMFLKIPVAGTFNLSGSIDFIYNKEQPSGYFSSLSDLRNGYFLFDGKYNLSSTVKEGQLQFYSYLLFQKTRKIPSKLGFVEWSKGQFKEVPFAIEYARKIEQTLISLRDSGVKISEILKTKNSATSSFFQDNLVPRNPGNPQCSYCLGAELCPDAKEKGFAPSQRTNYSALKKSTQNDILLQGLQNTPVSEITL